MKDIINKLISYKTLSKNEAKSILINISRGKFNSSLISSFLTVFMMRNITLEELQGFKEALLELCIKIDLSNYNTIDLCGTGETIKILLTFRLYPHLSHLELE